MARGEDRRGQRIGEATDSQDTQTSGSVRQEIEVILTRQLAGYLALPMVLVDPQHQILYYNEAAETMLGRRFDEGAPIPWAGWAQAFHFVDDKGDPIPSDHMPLATALRRQRLAHRAFWLRGLDGMTRHMEETAIPLIGNAGRFLGAVAFFTELDG
jgi:PAS domain-containing protein